MSVTIGVDLCSEARSYLRDARQRRLGREKRIRSRAKLLDLLWREDVRPLLRILAVFLGLPDGWAFDLPREPVEGQDMVVQRGVLAGSLQAVGKDVDRRGTMELMGRGG